MLRRSIIFLGLLLLATTEAETYHAPVYLLDSDRINCSVTNVKQEPSGRVLALTASHCIKPNRQFDTVKGAWEDLPGYAPFVIMITVTHEPLGEGAVISKEGDLALIAYTPHKPVVILPYKPFSPEELRAYPPVIACGVMIGGDDPEHQSLCVSGLWLHDIIRYEGLTFWAIQVPVRAGMSGGPILHKGAVIGIYSIQVITGSVAGMTPINAVIPYLEGTR